jgi:tetraacyldisaccharide 4'-kinase
MENLEQFVIDVIEGRRSGTRAGVAKFFLLILSLPFKAVVQFRLWLYRKRFKRETSLGCLVISVGNLTAGGTGKTPVVEKFARALHSAGRKVAILSRGYRSEGPTFGSQLKMWLQGRPYHGGTRVVSDGLDLLLDSREAGDEPYMLAKNLPGVVVLTDKDRVRSGRYALDNFQSDTLVLDDGLQYLHLKHRVEIVLIDRQSPFGNRHLLPRGTLREPPRNIRRASHIFITKSDGSDNAELISEIRQHNQKAEVIECAHRLTHLVDMAGNRHELDFLQARKVGALSGIARPESFHRLLREEGANLVEERIFPDHHRFRLAELLGADRRSREAGAECIVTTEKDFVRFPANLKLDLPVYYVRLEIEILSGHESWEQLVERIAQPPPLERTPSEFFA